MHLLAFDLSTTVLGYSIFEKESSKFVKMDFYSFQQDELIDRCHELINFITTLLDDDHYQINQFAIEANLKSFRAGGTNASAMLNTSKLNFCCQYYIKYHFKIPISEINVNSARNFAYPGFTKISRLRKGVKDKEIAFEMVCKELGEEMFPKKIMKSGPRKGVEVFIDEATDMSDSFVIGKATLLQEKQPVKTVKGKTKKTAKAKSSGSVVS